MSRRRYGTTGANRPRAGESRAPGARNNNKTELFDRFKFQGEKKSYDKTDRPTPPSPLKRSRVRPLSKRGHVHEARRNVARATDFRKKPARSVFARARNRFAAIRAVHLLVVGHFDVGSNNN